MGSVASVALTALAGLCCMSSGCSTARSTTARSAVPDQRTRSSDSVEGRLPSDGPLPGHALIYAEKQGKEADPRTPTLYNLNWQIMWLPGAGGRPARTVYVGGPKMWFNGRLPVYFGFLPSPDGSRVCVWETHYGPPGRWEQPTETVWTMVELPGGEKRKIHSQRELDGRLHPPLYQGLSGYLPVWLDNDRLQLEKGDLRATYDVRTGKLSPALPAESKPPADYYEAHDRDVDEETTEAVAWRKQYLAQYFPDDRRVLDEALRTLPTELGLMGYLRERDVSHLDARDDLLLRPVGVVGLWGPWVRYDKRVWPSIAISPDQKLVARTGVVASGKVFTLDRAWSTEKGPWGSNTFEARVDVYELSSRTHLWGMSVPRPSTSATDVSVSDHDCWFNDIRWSQDGRYLSFTWHQPPYGYDRVVVVDALTWREVLRVSNASNAFVAPYVAEAGR